MKIQSAKRVLPDKVCNIKNRTIYCKDNLDVLRGINSDCIELIYLDPPFNKNKKFTAPIGSSAEGAEFKDIFREEDLKEEWLQTIEEDYPEIFHYLNGIRGVGKPYNFSYLAYMIIRLMECHRVLKPTGSIYLHCDPTMSHYLKVALDCIFGEDCFRNEIVWCYTGPGSPNLRQFNRKHDILFWYNGGSKNWTFNSDKVRIPHKRLNTNKKGAVIADALTPELRDEYIKRGKVPETWWPEFTPVGRLKWERTGYPTQKPLALLERIITASSNEGDTVLDPFCGCATTCVAAERLNRNWIGIDISIKAFELVKERLTKEAADPYDLFKYQNIINLQTSPPKRSDLGVEHREKKFVYAISHHKYPDEYKVGIAKNPKARLYQYQTSDPERSYKLEFQYETPWFRQTEQYIHEIFENRHEWVSGDLKDIIREIKDFKPSSSNI